jgi:MFS family permease
VAVLYFIAAVFCSTLPPAPPPTPARKAFGRQTMSETEKAVESIFAQLREGLDYISKHREIRWSLIYLGVAASLVGVLGVLGPAFAETTLGLQEEDFVVVVLPLGIGIVMGILLLNTYGKLLPRRRVIEGGLVALGFLILAMALSGRISNFLASTQTATGLPDLSLLTSLLSIVVAVAFFAGIAYAFVAIPAQTQLQEDLPEDVRGRVFGVLNMLVSVASFLPILIVGPIADVIGTTLVLSFVAIAIVAAGFASIFVRGSLKPAERGSRYDVGSRDPIVAALRAAEMPTPDPGPDFVEDMIEERQAGVTMAPRTGDTDAAPPAPPARRRRDD